MTATTQAVPAHADPIGRRSVEVLKAGQAPSGAFVASPEFDVYRYAWLRDGAFCAHALDVAGERETAARWHRWVAASVEAHRGPIEDVTRRVATGETPPHSAMPPARYTLEGGLEPLDDDPWPNFQVDGYGMWLWALDEHLSLEPLPAALAPTVELVAAYLQAAWRLECFNCWEEFDGGVHTSTLAAIHRGLVAAARLLEDERWAAEAEDVRAYMLYELVVDGRFGRGRGDDRVDGSLLWLGVPFGVLALDDPLLEATVEQVRRDLTGPGGGIYRYLGDTYYGGGEWLLLTSSLAWHDGLAGNRDAFERSRAWVRAQARANGDLPEQVVTSAQVESMIDPWRRRWGEVATPLLWSHAMYLIVEATALR
jgi:GH15 family glucan-1,4-alpha-glucosidase